MTVRWGIAGTGRIAASFAQALARVPDGRLAAVASRTTPRAEAFAQATGASRAHGSLASLLADETVDAVYVASPHSEHRVQTVAALEAGKSVLVEKPFALDAREATLMVDAARASGGFLMEAMWSRFLPAYARLRELRDTGVLGEIRSVAASFGFPAPPDPEGRLLNPALGGGALLDIGIYPVHLAHWLLGPPAADDAAVDAVAVLGPTGVDLDTVVSMSWPQGAVAVAQCSLSSWLPTTGFVAGSDATVELPFPHHHPDSLVVRTPNGESVEQLPVGGDGLRYEIAHVHACLRDGLVESPVMPLRDTFEILTTLDRARAAIARRRGHPDDQVVPVR